MSYFRGGKNGGHFYSNLTQPIKIDLNFVVDSTNGNGLGIRALKSNGWVRNVFMNTSAALTGTVTNTSFNITAIAGGTSSLIPGMPVQGTDIPAGTVITKILTSSSVAMSQAATGSPGSASITYQGFNNGYANPNPAAGYALVQFKQNFNIYLGGFTGFVSPVSGTPIDVTAGLTIGDPYVIVSVGTTTQAQWQALGLPPGFAPSVGQSFIATSAANGVGTGIVEAPADIGSGIQVIDVIGSPNQSIANSSIAVNGGAWVLVRFSAATSSSVTTLVATAPADSSACGMAFYFDQSVADPIMQDGDPVGA